MKIGNLFFLILIIALTGCSDSDGMQAAQRETNATEMVHIPGCDGCFLYRKKNGSIWYIHSNGYSKPYVNVQLLTATENTE